MDAGNDPKFLQLYRDYAQAIQAFDNATRDRRRVRNQLAVKRSPVIRALQEWGRRPVSSPGQARVPGGQSPPSPAGPAVPARPVRVYLGDILGWAKVVYTPTVVPESDPIAGVDVDRLYGEISLNVYWNAKIRYEKCRRAFFDYVRRQNIDLHRERARGALQHGAELQFLGADQEDDPEWAREARREVDAACRDAWALYQTGGPEKSAELKVLLLRSIADAQFVGLESATVQAMTSEMHRLIASGDIAT